MTTINVTFKIRRDSTLNWSTYDPVLQEGEIGLDTTLNKIKIGNGNSHWTTLPFATILATDLAAAISEHNQDTTNVHGIADTAALATKTYVDDAVTSLANTSDSSYIPVGDLGNPDGVATLDSNGQVPLAQLANLVDSAPTALNTLNELAAALGDDANFSTTVTSSLGTLSSQVSSFDARIVNLELGLGI